MLSRLFHAGRELVKRRPLVANCIVYGSLYCGAEFSQQTLRRTVLLREGEPKPDYDVGALKRYAIVGSCVFPVILFYWYRWLDARFPINKGFMLVKKVFLDQALITPFNIAVFYVAMSLLERKPDPFAEVRAKIVPTYLTSCVYWIPMTSINFLLMPPSARVAYVAVCQFVWVNILCWFKRQSYESPEKQG